MGRSPRLLKDEATRQRKKIEPYDGPKDIRPHLNLASRAPGLLEHRGSERRKPKGGAQAPPFTRHQGGKQFANAAGASALGHRFRGFARSRLGGIGWYDDGATELRFWTGANGDPVVPINPGILLWERLPLSDGTLARLVTTVPQA